MLLNSTTRKLQVLLGEAQVTNPCPIVASYFDSAATPGGGPSFINSNGVTAVDAVAAPAASTIRQVNEMTVFNADTVSHGVIVRYNDNGTTYVIIKATLAPGYTLTYSKSLGWAVMSPTGLFIAGQIPGTATNDDAAAGMVGEFISSTVLAGSAVALTNGVSANVTSISLTAGDWDVEGYIEPIPAGTLNTVICWTSTVSATTPTRPNNGGIAIMFNTLAPTGFFGMTIGRQRIKLAATTTVYLSCNMSFSSTCGAYGFIGARRAR